MNLIAKTNKTTTDYSNIIQEVKRVFKELFGFDSISRFDDENIRYFVINHNFALFEFRQYMDYELNSETKMQHYQKNPDHLYLGSLFHPKREDAIIRIVNQKKLAIRRKEQRESGASDSPVKEQLIKLRCGAIISRIYEKRWLDDKKFKWVWSNREEYSNHFNECKKSH